MELTGRTLRRKPLATFGAILVALIAAPVAGAHSVLIATAPSKDAIVETSPELVVLTFDEPVDSALGSVRVYDGSGERVDTDDVGRPTPEVVTTGIDGDLSDGTYTVTWRVISADQDPINGAFVFHVGAPGANPGGVATNVVDETSGAVSFLYTAARFLDYTLMLLGAGGALILALVLPMAAPSLRRRLYQGLAVLAACLVLVALLSFVLQGAYAGGLSLADAVEWDVVSAVAGTRFGEMALLRAGLAALLAVAAFVLSRRDGSRVGAISCIALGVGLLVTPVASGHASVAGKIAFAADYAHILAAAAWTGGLAFLVAALLMARSERWSLASRSVPRFSNLAVVSVGLLVVAGAINGYIEVRHWRGLWDTEYGVLLMAKVALVVPLLGLGAFNNKFAVPKLKSGTASPQERRRFLRAVGAELSVMVVIVGVTAFLVNAAPAYKLVEMHSGSGTNTVELGPHTADVTVDPATAGSNEISLVFQHSGSTTPDEVVVLATLASEGIGPLRYVAEPTGSGFVVPDAQLSIPGEWELRIEAREGEFDLYTDTISIPIER